ncbi:MAG: M28 family peptidase [Elusimicrobia bacterium]|nr:M28 family peptidase [Elusimicrobiota bacterium]
MLRRTLSLAVVAFLAAPLAAKERLASALESIDAVELRRHIEVLASDEFEGRAPGGKGEELTVGYLAEGFKALGLAPGNPDGTYVQNVPLVGITGKPTASFRTPAKTVELAFPADFVAVTRRPERAVTIDDSELVFVGYGVEAPEYGWDDYKGTDLKGKTLVMLINDPPIKKADGSLDDSMFKGRGMTYYGRWTYKYEIASAKGAAAAIIVHETEAAAYPWEVVQNSWGHENFHLKDEAAAGRVSVESWISSPAVSGLLTLAGKDFAELKRLALRKDFKPIPLGIKADISVLNEVREVNSRNVAGLVPGSDPKAKAELVIYSAHWDHLGKDVEKPGDGIFNGALDNATGVAGLLELAQAYARLSPAPRRSVLFLSVTAEEQGLLGAKHYAAHPLYPLAKTQAVVNMDVINPWGRTRDLADVGLGNTTLDDILVSAARRRGRVVTGDPEPEKGHFYRSDHFEFAKKGVPSLNYGGGLDFIDKPAGYGKAKREDYTARVYHKVTDQVDPAWDLSGAVEDLGLLFEVGLQVADGEEYPGWKPGTEFKAAREASLR